MFEELTERQQELYSAAKTLLEGQHGVLAERYVAIEDFTEIGSVEFYPHDRSIKISDPNSGDISLLSNGTVVSGLRPNNRSLAKLEKLVQDIERALNPQPEECDPWLAQLKAKSSTNSSLSVVAIKVDSLVTDRGEETRQSVLTELLSEHGLLSEEYLYVAIHESRLGQVLIDGGYIEPDPTAGRHYIHGHHLEYKDGAAIIYDGYLHDVFYYLDAIAPVGEKALIIVYDKSHFDSAGPNSEYTFLDPNNKTNALVAIIHISDHGAAPGCFGT